MVLPRIYIRRTYIAGLKSGITLLEVLVVVGLFTLVAGLALVASFGSFQGNGFRNERDSLMQILQKARSQSMSGVCLGASCTGAKQHGVKIQTSSYVLFQGPSFAGRDVSVDETFPANYSIIATGITEMVFKSLSGDAAPASVGNLTITDQAGHASVVTINSEGRITWTN